MPAAPSPLLRASSAAMIAAALMLACDEKPPPVQWFAAIDGPSTVAPGSVVQIRVEARSTGGWYFYSATQPEGGPIPTRIWLADSSFEQGGALRSPEPSRTFDNTFGFDVEKYPGAVSFALPVRVPQGGGEGKTKIRVNALYQACNDTICLSPRTVTLAVPIKIESP